MNGLKPRVLVFVVAYNAEKTISTVIRRIPAALAESYDVQVLIIDDASRDDTFAKSHSVTRGPGVPFPVHVLFNPVNQGYGGNQKLGYHYAIDHGYDFVALLHGDGQYAPECLPQLLDPLRHGEADAVFGSRMLDRFAALKGGMPLYKYVGNRILTAIENKLLRSTLSEFHSGYRIYSVEALKAIPFERNSNDFHFDTEIIIQLLIARRRIAELPIPTFYGDEICHVNGLRYAWNVVSSALKARMQEISLFYDPRFDCAPGAGSPYTLKLGYASTHTYALDAVAPDSKVLDLGCAGGYLGRELGRRKQCSVSSVDFTLPSEEGIEDFRLLDLNEGLGEVRARDYDAVLMLDVIEHLSRPEAFLEALRREMAARPSAELMISTANVACVFTRLMLLAGQFNYGKRGILDMTHTRLFTFSSMKRALQQAGFTMTEVRGVPAPYPLAIGDHALSRALVAINQFLIRISRGLFAYQIFIRAKALPTVETLLNHAREQSHIRAELLEASGAARGLHSNDSAE